MWGLIGSLLNGALGLWNSIFSAKNQPDIKKSEQINNENKKLEQFNSDTAKAAQGDKEALERIRAGLSRPSQR